ncbi:hypothetical protein PHYSODRAFT_327970 [Phytophthora sojae]|uniref:Uncharacterized protein n=1 Tax=Phytophthora sojae (strain P6497) TaxID=1094619 RepID=G4Z9T3_PHYSP|nr:hypothetical protein PHYSODRAFT_327970 [Phytophthora sojae]EGZ19786.1 hypothetical protein PHYSODRAFT_327970 [Phytophthora sojae]|eukprot:XP_009522503.1 hypothetical protein PHYSODRAFT_327970 [Phytophthora sojae]
MPKKGKRLKQIAALAAAERARDRQARHQAVPAPLEVLRQEALSTPWCCPRLAVDESDTSSLEDNSSDFGEVSLNVLSLV